MIDQDNEWLHLISPELAIAVAVLEEQHVRRAAERLGVPQPTVSVVMRRLGIAIGARWCSDTGAGSWRPQLAARFCPRHKRR